MTILVQRLRAEIEQLRAQLEMTNKHGEVLQQIGNALRLGAGSDLHTACVPEIQRLKAETGRYRWLRANDAHPADWSDADIDAAMRDTGGV